MRRPFLIAAALLVPGSACQSAPTVAAADATASADTGPACSQPRQTPSGQCCAADAIYSEQSKACVAALPPTCTGDIDHSDNCWPQWCFRWLTASRAPCDPQSAKDCGILPDLCSSGREGMVQCPAGWFVHRQSGGACVPAGQWQPGDPTPVFDQGAATKPLGPTVPPRQAPPVTDLPSLENTRFCRNAAGEPDVACPPTAPCGPLQYPDSTQSGDCQPIGLPQNCPLGFAPAPANGSLLAPCAPDPDDCGAAPYGDDVPTGKVVFVDAGAPASGNGTLAAPFTALMQGVQAVPPGGTVAVAAGSYDLPGLAISKPLFLMGRCAALVKVQGAGGAALQFGGAAVGGVPAVAGVSGVTLQGARPGIRVQSGWKVAVQRVQIAKAAGYALMAEGTGQLEVAFSVVAGGQPDETGLSLGAYLRDSAQLTLQQVRVSGIAGIGLLTEGSSAALLQQCVIDGGRPGKLSAAPGLGIACVGGAVTLRGVRLADNFNHALLATGSKATVDAQGLLADHTQAPAPPTRAAGVALLNGAAATLQYARLSQNQDQGLLVRDGSHADGRALLIDATLPVPGRELSGNCLAIDGGSADLSHARVTGCRSGGAWVNGSNGRLGAAGFALDHVQADPSDGSNGGCLYAENGGQVTLDQAHLSHCHRVAAEISQNAALRATDLLVEHLDGDNLKPGEIPIGVAVDAQSELHWHGGRIDDVPGVAVATAQVQAAAKGAAVGLVGVAFSGVGNFALGDKDIRFGAYTVYGGKLMLAGCRLDGAPLGAVGADAVAQAWGVLANGPAQKVPASTGYAAFAGAGAWLDWFGSYSTGAQGAAIHIDSASLRIYDSALVHVTDAEVPGLQGTGLVHIGDGVAAFAGKLVDCRRLAVSQVARAGVLLSQVAQAKLELVLSSQNQFGLATQEGGTLQVNSCAFWANGTANVLTDHGLSLPAAPALAKIPGGGGP